MAKKPTTPDPQAILQEAEARLKTATERHAAVVSFLSRPGASAQDKRLAQSESKKVEHELREATLALQEAQAAAARK
jgi:hypothetical protein